MPARIATVTEIVPTHTLLNALDEADSIGDLKEVIEALVNSVGRVVRCRNPRTGEEWAGHLVVCSGGMVVFDVVDERGVTVGAGEAVPDPIAAEQPAPTNRNRVRVGRK